MKRSLGELVAELRLLVGFLGEKNQSNWWGSSFIGNTSDAFLLPIFPRTALLARYHGVTEGAMLLHDEFIGKGSHYHLYRLPDSIERLAESSLSEGEFNKRAEIVLGETELALQRMGELANSNTEAAEGPVAIGDYTDDAIESLLHQAASYYFNAFKEGVQCFPYIRVK